MAGFESSSHRLPNGHRLDLLETTQHDRFAALDYARLRELGIQTVRDAVRWHRVETRPGHYDWSSVMPMLAAARDQGMQVIWDVCHYGWPDGDLDIFSPAFVDRFAAFAAAFARLVTSEMDGVPFFVPVNEISFWAWGSDVGYLNPFAVGRALDLKVQLVRSAIAAIEAIWQVAPNARIVHTDPLIHVVANPRRPQDIEVARAKNESQFEAWDMIAGRRHPQAGGDPKYLDIVGVNFYPHNQWIHVPNQRDGITISRWSPLYRPFSEILASVFERYGRPMIMAETGTEHERRADWLRYVGREARAAIDAGVPLDGICLYPILNHPGWDDDRHCYCGLWDYCDDTGAREIYQPLADEIRRQVHLMERRADAGRGAGRAPNGGWVLPRTVAARAENYDNA